MYERTYSSSMWYACSRSSFFVCFWFCFDIDFLVTCIFVTFVISFSVFCFCYVDVFDTVVVGLALKTWFVLIAARCCRLNMQKQQKAKWAFYIYTYFRTYVCMYICSHMYTYIYIYINLIRVCFTCCCTYLHFTWLIWLPWLCYVLLHRVGCLGTKIMQIYVISIFLALQGWTSIINKSF